MSKKEIKITFEQTQNEKGEYEIQTELETQGNVSPFELLGLLRHFEKQVFIRISTSSQSQSTFNHKTD